MKHPNRIRNSDYAALLRLAGEVGELPLDPTARRRHAVEGLCRILDSPFGLFMHTSDRGASVQFAEPVVVLHDPTTRGLFDGYFAGRYPLDPCTIPIHFATPPGLHVALRRELVSDQDWYASVHVNTIRRDFRLDDGIYVRVVNPSTGDTFGQCFCRPTGDRPFTERHREIVQAFNAAAAGLYLLDAPRPVPAPIDRLAPRLRPVAERFLAGDSVKEAARYLGLSRHTVVEYAKHIYRALGVTSRAELLIVLMRGGDGRPGN